MNYSLYFGILVGVLLSACNCLPFDPKSANKNAMICVPLHDYSQLQRLADMAQNYQVESVLDGNRKPEVGKDTAGMVNDSPSAPKTYKWKPRTWQPVNPPAGDEKLTIIRDESKDSGDVKKSSESAQPSSAHLFGKADSRQRNQAATEPQPLISHLMTQNAKPSEKSKETESKAASKPNRPLPLDGFPMSQYDRSESAASDRQVPLQHSSRTQTASGGVLAYNRKPFEPLRNAHHYGFRMR